MLGEKENYKYFSIFRTGTIKQTETKENKSTSEEWETFSK